MFARLLLLFIVLPTAELWLLFQVGDLVGLWPTLALILLTGILGSVLAKREGVSTWQRLQGKLKSGGLPGTELLDGVIILVAGALLVTPGVMTDFVGFLGLIPPTRALIRKQITTRFQQSQQNRMASFQTFTFGTGAPRSGFGEFPADGAFGPSSEAPDEGRAAWQGEGRQVPSYAEEPGETSSRAD